MSISNDLKDIVIDLYNEGKTLKEIANETGLTISQIEEIISEV